MFAVKQVGIPGAENGGSDNRRVTVVEALRHESEVLKELDHSNVVQYIGFEETARYLNMLVPFSGYHCRNADRDYSFLEYVPGGSISSILKKHGRFNENVTKSFTYQILDGLGYLHSKGIIHRVWFFLLPLVATLTWKLSQNLKADNILVEEFGHCKISGFGISKKTDDINRMDSDTAMQGNVFRMAPEAVRGQGGYNSKIDIWSVGCIAFEMWTGERPWKGEEAIAVALRVCIRFS